MNKSVKEKCISVIYGVICGVVLLQTVLAAIWAVGNFTSVQGFEDSRLYLSMAEGGFSDGFHLIGYVLLINLSKWLGGVFKLPFTVFLYLLQLIIVQQLTDKGMGAFLRGLAGKKVPMHRVAILTTLVVTNPFLWQMTFAVLPDAISFALSFYILGYMFLWMKREEERNTPFAVVSFLAFLILGIWERKAFWVTGTSVVILCLIGWIRTARAYRKNRFKAQAARFIVPVAGVAICLLCAVFVNKAIRKDTYQGEYMEYSLQADAMKRFVYPNLMDSYPNYTDEFKEQMPDYIISTFQKGGMEYYYNSMGPMMEIRWGAKKTKKLCGMLNIKAATSHKSYLAKETAKEWFAGTFSPFILAKKRYPLGDSINPLYLNLMWKKMPNLTDLYVTIGRIGYPVCIVFMLLCGILSIADEGKERFKSLLKTGLLFGGLILQTALSPLLLSVPEFNFRNVLLPCMLWAVVGMAMMISKKDEELFFIGKETKWEKQH